MMTWLKGYVLNCILCFLIVLLLCVCVLAAVQMIKEMYCSYSFIFSKLNQVWNKTQQCALNAFSCLFRALILNRFLTGVTNQSWIVSKPLLYYLTTLFPTFCQIYPHSPMRWSPLHLHQHHLAFSKCVI